MNAMHVEELAVDLFEAYKLCFCADSTEKWIKIFCEKRLDTIDTLRIEEGEKPLTKAFRKKVTNRFAELMLDYVAQCKKQRRKKEREKLDAEKENIRKNGVKRGKVK